VSAWATKFVCDEHPRISDWVAWNTLKSLVGADARADPDEYIYHEVDFKKWQDDLLGNPSG
jgi:hypothetical protein